MQFSLQASFGAEQQYNLGQNIRRLAGYEAQLPAFICFRHGRMNATALGMGKRTILMGEQIPGAGRPIGGRWQLLFQDRPVVSFFHYGLQLIRILRLLNRGHGDKSRLEAGRQLHAEQTDLAVS
ncbi:hypothetical protein D3C71_1526020 [compost metagenome]